MASSATGKRPFRSIQYQQAAGPVLVAAVVAAISITTLSSPVRYDSYLIYQSHTEPVLVPPPVVPAAAAVVSTNSSQVIFSKQLLYQSVAFVAPVTETINYDKWGFSWSEPVRFKRFPTSEQQAYTAPTYTPEFVSADKWIYPWTEPVRQKIGLRASLQQALIALVLVDDQITGTLESRWHYPWSEPVRFRRFPTHEQQSQVQGSVYPFEIVTPDKWIYPWSEPVRQKIGLKAYLQQAFIAPVLDDETQIIQDFESRWHFPWSEPVRLKRLHVSQYPVFTADTRTPEFITGDKWSYPWSEPVRFRRFPTSEQQAYAAPVYTPEFVTVDKWIYQWSEPVRQKIGLKTHLQQAAIGPVLEPETQISQDYESRWHYAWSEPVRIKQQVPVSEQQFQIQGPVQTPEFITVDKWIYGWSEPVRQKIGLKTHLQQAYIAPVLNPDTQISQDFESRWHFAWSEPVRVKRPLLTAQQQSVAYQSAFFETINIDKWGFAWSEPVRQKIGLKANLQQAFIGLTLEPETQIIQGYESRWHFAWSEPVKVKAALRAGLQQAQAQGPVRTPEFITVDKWIYPWTDPVRQKIGLKTHLQQAFIAPVLNPETQIIQGFESRWHQPWSEPVRFRRFPTAEQSFVAAPVTSVFEIITPDKWIYPWSEPVRHKRGLKTNLQQAFIGLTLNPERQIIQGYESRWHQPWSTPVIPRRMLTGEHQNLIYTGRVVTELITLDKWNAPWSEPVRFRRISVALQPAFTTDPAPVVPAQIDKIVTSAFFSQPIFKKRLIYQSLAEPIAVAHFIPGQWSDPLRRKPGLGAWLQQIPAAGPPTYPILFRTIPWFAPLNEPVRLKIGFYWYEQRAFTTDPYPIANPFTVLLDATEVNSDSALFGITVYSSVPVVVGVPTVVVSIKEIPAIDRASVSVEEDQAIDNASASIAES